MHYASPGLKCLSLIDCCRLTGSYQDNKELLKERRNFHFEKPEEKMSEWLLKTSLSVFCAGLTGTTNGWELDEGKLGFSKGRDFLMLREE